MKKYHLFSVSANDVLLSHMITFLNDKVGLWNKSNTLTQLLSDKPKLHLRVEPYCNQNSYWRKYVHEVLVNRLGGLSLPRKSVVRLTDRPDMTLDVYRGRKTTNQIKINRTARTP